MKTILLKAEERKTLGTKESKALRSEGKVPCVMYGLSEPRHFAVYAADFTHLVYTPSVYKVQLDIDGNQYNAIMADLQFHPVSEVILHADFYEVDPSKAVLMNIPIQIEGNAPGVRAGGKLVKKIAKLRVRGLIGNLPDSIPVNIDTLEIGQSVKVKDLSVNGFEILDSKENAIVSCKITRAALQAEQAAAAEAKGKK
jgi:large subunit ribosomal protein L25